MVLILIILEVLYEKCIFPVDDEDVKVLILIILEVLYEATEMNTSDKIKVVS